LSKRASNFNYFDGTNNLFKLQSDNLALAQKYFKGHELSRERAEEMRKRSQEFQGKLKSFTPKEFGNFNFNLRGMDFWSGSRLGASVEALTEQLGNYFGVKDGHGVLVTEVFPESAAAKAGLKAGDVILEIDNQKVNNTGDLATALSKKEEGQVVLKILRNRDEKNITVTLEKREVRPATRRKAMVYSQRVDMI
jgi:C-terminal processing protease CtpA/Prc